MQGLLQRVVGVRPLPVLATVQPFVAGLHRRIPPRPHRQMSVSAQGRQVVSTDKAPGAVGPYSQAIKVGGLVFVSGQLGFIPGTKEFAAEDVEGQAEQVMLNLGAVLEAAGSSFGKARARAQPRSLLQRDLERELRRRRRALAQVAKTTVLLASMDDFAKVNAVYSRYFPEAPPARACYAVKTLPANALVEIEAIAEAA